MLHPVEIKSFFLHKSKIILINSSLWRIKFSRSKSSESEHVDLLLRTFKNYHENSFRDKNILRIK